jgi:hypothetical protein
MKRTTIYFDPELEVRLKLEMQRQKRPMAELVREAVEVYVARAPRTPPPGGGAFSSGKADTAERAEAVLADTGFGETPAPAAPATSAALARARRRKKR